MGNKPNHRWCLKLFAFSWFSWSMYTRKVIRFFLKNSLSWPKCCLGYRKEVWLNWTLDPSDWYCSVLPLTFIHFIKRKTKGKVAIKVESCNFIFSSQLLIKTQERVIFALLMSFPYISSGKSVLMSATVYFTASLKKSLHSTAGGRL